VALRRLSSGEFVRGIHSLGDLSPERRFVVHFPQSSTIWSIGSGYGGNAQLSKKCHALRIASVQAREQGWLAEHIGVPRNDSMAMLPFCGYNMGDYFQHWLSIGDRLRKPPRIFHVNWFRRGDDGEFLWPGFGDNVRVLDWIVRRVEASAEADETPIGFVPNKRSLALRGLDLPDDRIRQLLAVDANAWLEEVTRNTEFIARFGDRFPAVLANEHRELPRRLTRCQN
jgi:phosphoenolpyruvate carboxykinase (GTP)